MELATKEFVAGIQEELGVQFDWFGAVHENTAHPHTHLVFRGVDTNGRELNIPKRFYKERRPQKIGSKIVTRHLGERTDKEIYEARAREVKARSFTSLDRKLLSLLDEENSIDLRSDVFTSENPKEASLLKRVRARVRALHKLGFAEKTGFFKFYIHSNIFCIFF